MLVGHRMELNDRYSLELVLVVNWKNQLEWYRFVDNKQDVAVAHVDDVEFYSFEEHVLFVFAKIMLCINDSICSNLKHNEKEMIIIDHTNKKKSILHG